MSKCKKCGADVIWNQKPTGGFFPPENPDGSRHDCEGKHSAPKQDLIIGLLTGYNSGSATFRLKDGSTKTYAITSGMRTAWEAAGYGPDHWIEFALDKDHFVLPNARIVNQPEWGAALKDPTNGEIKTPMFVKASELPKNETPAEEIKTDCTSLKIPTVDLLVSMSSDSNGYWKAKFYSDLQTREDIRRQVEWKNWHDCLELAMTHRPVDAPIEDLEKLAELIHAFIKGKVGGVQ